MKNKKAKKVIKIVSITLASIIVVSIAAFYITLNFVIKPKSKDIIKAVDEIIEDEEIKKAIEPYLGQERLDELLKSIDDSKAVKDYNDASGDDDNSEEKGNSQNDDDELQKSNGDTLGKKGDLTQSGNGEKTGSQNKAGSSKATNKNTSGNKAEATQPPKKNRSEYNSQYDYVKDNIPSSDFSRGMALASRVDIGYISGLLAGGLTSEEKSELKSYLTSRFSGSEIAEGISLYSKYSHLLR